MSKISRAPNRKEAIQCRSAGHDLLAINTPVRDKLDRMTQQSSRRGVEAMRTSGAASSAPQGTVRQAVLPLTDPRQDAPAAEPAGRDFWIDRVREALAARSSQAVEFADEGLRAWPIDPELLLLAALTALAVRQPERALALLKRYGKRYVPGKPVTLLNALALGQQGHFARALAMLQAEHLDTDRVALGWFVGDDVMQDWLFASLHDIRLERLRSQTAPRASAWPTAARPPKTAAVRPPVARPPAARPNARHLTQIAPSPPVVADLPRLEAQFDMSFELANADAIEIVGAEASPEPGPFRLRAELVRLSLFEGFDELLCLPTLQGVEAHWYQVETVRKVLKHYRGRVLLADEVGLGKTVEAGMVLKEYMLRGMAERILILTPASLVGQWRDEMASKFGIDCATSHDPLSRSDPARFWAQSRVIASIAAARRKEQADLLAGLSYDVVVVDEAHHLRDQASASYRLVNSLQKRFLLLLSATPVQNSLLELYNLLTLLQPGIFKTQKEFRSVYMVAGKPREPANRDRLRELMRGVMVRNTRALAALRMPRRQASTLRALPDPAEAACYDELSALVRELAAGEVGASPSDVAPHRLSLQHLLTAAGSSPAAAAGAIARIAERFPGEPRWTTITMAACVPSAPAQKEAALLRLLAQNPAERKNWYSCITATA